MDPGITSRHRHPNSAAPPKEDAYALKSVAPPSGPLSKGAVPPPETLKCESVSCCTHGWVYSPCCAVDNNQAWLRGKICHVALARVVALCIPQPTLHVREWRRAAVFARRGSEA